MILAAQRKDKQNPSAKTKKENFKPKISCPPHLGAQLCGAAGAQRSPLSLRTFQSPSSSSPLFSRGTSWAGRQRAVSMASLLHKIGLICVLFTFESRTLPRLRSQNIGKLQSVTFSCVVCDNRGWTGRQRKFSFDWHDDRKKNHSGTAEALMLAFIKVFPAQHKVTRFKRVI